MFKLILILLCLIFPLSPVTSKDVIVTGYGQTRAEAEKDARDKLTEKIYGGIVTVDKKLYTYDDNKEYKNQYSETSTFTSTGEIKGVEYSSFTDDGTNYNTTAKISDDILPTVYSDIKRLSDNITITYKTTSNSYEGKAMRYYRLIELLDAYDRAKALALALGATEYDITPLKINISKASLEIEFGDYLNDIKAKEISKLENADKTSLGYLEINAKIEEIDTTLDDITSETIRTMEDEEKRLSEIVDSKLIPIFNDIANFKGSSSNTGISDQFHNIQALYSAINKKIKEIESIKYGEEQRLYDKYKTASTKIEQMPYPAYQLNGDGNPTADAISERNDTLNKLNTRYTTILQEFSESIDKNTAPRIQEMREELVRKIKNLEKQQFYINAVTDEFIWNGDNQYWEARAKNYIDNKSVVLNVNLDFKTFTDKEFITYKDVKNGIATNMERENSMTAFNLNNEVLTKTPQSYPFTIKYAVKFEPTTGEFKLTPLEIWIHNLNNKKIMIDRPTSLILPALHIDSYTYENLGYFYDNIKEQPQYDEYTTLPSTGKNSDKPKHPKQKHAGNGHNMWDFVGSAEFAPGFASFPGMNQTYAIFDLNGSVGFMLHPNFYMGMTGQLRFFTKDYLNIGAGLELGFPCLNDKLYIFTRASISTQMPKINWDIGLNYKVYKCITIGTTLTTKDNFNSIGMTIGIGVSAI